MVAVYKFSRKIVEKFKSFKRGKEGDDERDDNHSLDSENGINEIERSNLGTSRLLSRIRHSFLNSFDIENPDEIDRSNVGTSRILSRIRNSFLNSFDIENTNDNTESAENNHFCCFSYIKNCCECHGMNQEVTHDGLDEKRILNESQEGITMKQIGKEV